MDTTKKPWQSKTLWMALLTAAAAFCPPVSAWISANPMISSWIISGVFAGLRSISKEKIVIS